MGTVLTTGKLKVVTPRHMPRPHSVMWSTRNEHVTLVTFIAANQTAIEKLIMVLPLKELPALQDQTLLDKISVYGQSKGWVTSEIVFNIMEKVQFTLPNTQFYNYRSITNMLIHSIDVHS